MLEPVLIFGLTLLCLYLVLAPLVDADRLPQPGSLLQPRPAGTAGAGESPADELEHLLDDLSDLEYDYRMDKVPEEVYRHRRRQLITRANELLSREEQGAALASARRRVLAELSSEERGGR